MKRSLSLALVPLWLAAAARAADLYSEAFNDEASARISTNNGSGGTVAYVDYSLLAIGAQQITIPEAPRRIAGSTPTRGVLLKIDYAAPTTDRIVNLIALDAPAGNRLAFTDNYRLKFDAYLRLSPSVTLAPAGGFPNETGTAEHLLWGIGYNANLPLGRSWRTGRGNGTWGWLATEGGYSATNGSDASVYVNGTLTGGRNLDPASADFAAYFIPAFSNTASPIPGAPANQWVETDITVLGGQVTVQFKGTTGTATKFFQNVQGSIAGAAMVGYEDASASTSFDPDNQWMLVDNMIVEDLTSLPTAANTAPTVVIQSAAMRGATGLMDVVFRVNDPDDATVKTRALAFIDGQRSFAKLIKPTTFAEGTGSKLGDAITTNTDHTLTWNVASDWNIDLGQIKFEILAMDNRGLLPLDWVTIPAANGQPELTISKNAPTDQEVLDALFWQYASGDPGLTLENGELKGSAGSGMFSGTSLAKLSSIQLYGPVWAMKSTNFAPADLFHVNQANGSRAILSETTQWHALKSAFDSISVATAFGSNTYQVSTIPVGLVEIASISAGSLHNAVLMRNGTVRTWGWMGNEVESAQPKDLSDVDSIASGYGYTLALKRNGTVVAWGYNNDGQTNIPPNLSDIKAIAAGNGHGLALKIDGSVIAWGENDNGQTNVPPSLPEVKSIAAGGGHSLALLSSGEVVQWGWSGDLGQYGVPPGLTGVKSISAGYGHSLALKTDGTVAAWGFNVNGQATVPAGLSGVVQVAAGHSHSLALKSDGTVVAWGWNGSGQIDIPTGSNSNISAVAGGYGHTILLKKAP